MNTIPDNEKYEYLLKTCAYNKEIWLLKATEDMYAMVEDASGQGYLPVWPGEKQALLLTNDDWSEYKVEKMPIFEFINWLPELENDEILIAAFPGVDMQIIPVNPLDLKNHFETELNKT